MQIGKYTLNQNVRVYPELTELSPEESAILQKAYDERTYKGPEVAISGQNWAVFLSALSDGSIFKIAAQFMSEDDETADQVFSATFAQNVRQFGQPHQVTPSGGQRWNLPFGNLILGRAGVPRMRAINLIATSDSRPVSQLELKMSGYSAHTDTLPYACSVQTAEGIVRIVTHDKACFVFRHPHTSIIPPRMRWAGYVSCTLQWKSSDPKLLADLHSEIVQLVQQLGTTGLFEIGKSVKAAMMLLGPDISRTVERAKAEGIGFPLPGVVLENLKRFT